MNAENIADKLILVKKQAREYEKRAWIDYGVFMNGFGVASVTVGSAEIGLALAAGILTCVSFGAFVQRYWRHEVCKLEALDLGGELAKSVTRPQVLENGIA